MPAPGRSVKSAVVVLLLSQASLQIQTDNARTNFPIRGNIASLDASNSVEMTCYKGGETAQVFNHYHYQFRDVA